jgi:hypothetical protein
VTSSFGYLDGDFTTLLNELGDINDNIENVNFNLSDILGALIDPSTHVSYLAEILAAL